MIHTQKIKLQFLNEQLTTMVTLHEKGKQKKFKIALNNPDITVEFTWDNKFLTLEYEHTIIFFSTLDEESFFQVRPIDDIEDFTIPIQIKKIELGRNFHIIYELIPNNPLTLKLERIEYS